MGAFISAFQNKLDAVHDLVLAFTARQTDTAADDAVINPTLTALNDEAADLEAALSANTAPTMPGPSAADATALQNAIKAAENAIARNATTNALAKAATTLLASVKVPP
jgi:hypothetical protein